MLSPGVAVVVAVLLMLLTDCVPAALARFAGSDPRIVEQRAELARLNGELANTSSTDEFAKWAKLRRRCDALAAEIEESATAKQGLEASRQRNVLMACRLVKLVIRSCPIYLYRTMPVVKFVDSTIPGPTAWWLSFGGGDRAFGTLSVVAWFYMVENVMTRIRGISRYGNGQALKTARTNGPQTSVMM